MGAREREREREREGGRERERERRDSLRAFYKDRVCVWRLCRRAWYRVTTGASKSLGLAESMAATRRTTVCASGPSPARSPLSATADLPHESLDSKGALGDSYLRYPVRLGYDRESVLERRRLRARARSSSRSCRRASRLVYDALLKSTPEFLRSIRTLRSTRSDPRPRPATAPTCQTRTPFARRHAHQAPPLSHAPRVGSRPQV